MSHKFDVKSKHKLDNEERRRQLPPYEILTDIGLKEGDTLADIGCGTGFFAIPASDIVGETGRVYAMDISLEMIEDVNKKIEEKSINNIKTVLTEESDFKIEPQSVNFAFISTVLHEIENKEKFLNEVNRILTVDGRIGIVEWRKIESEYGPPLQHRLEGEYIEHLLVKMGFKNIMIKNIGQYFYIITGEK